jgi:hypothetical protein
VFAPDKSPVKVQSEVLDISLGKLHIVYRECDVDRLRSVSFYSPFFKPGWFTVSVKQLLDHCPWLVLQYCRQSLLW